MKKMMQNYSLGAAACIVMGIALIIKPDMIGQVLNSIVGTVLIVWAAFGVLRFIMSRASDSDSRVGIMSLLGNIALLAGGIFVLVNERFLERAVMCTLGVYLIFSGVPKLFEAVSLKKYTDSWKKPMVSSLLTVVFGTLVLVMPLFIIDGVMRLLGVALTAAGIFSFVSGSSTAVLKKKFVDGRSKKNKKQADGTKVIDVKYEDE
ncbi:Uncharacterized membrane protein HdeD, DUF308 family [Ruminococcus sp. YE71]|uniref:HdeD family acid-resistance protein n=1 Tax=unclassified Ruminococcus TaxID=2608920 RepID=UPI000885ACC7|nr:MULTISPECIES: DUF308 domain-containing protein [unclassified Ruminococcus]SDA14273.1 Uncharacterized membrane protein HdeD, DUF308 family [Ruminococcus sp. YE78]SFW20788.1 Uncharacterized membrane protein HdeD, DUF308 family [Ruminococcus sp. YE71]